MTKLKEPQLEMLRNGKNFGVVATVDGQGHPQTSVVWVDTDGENLVFNTTNARAKGRNLRGRPFASVTVWDFDDAHRFFEVQGPVELTEDGAADHIEELSWRYDGHAFRAPVDRVIVRVRPDRVIDHGVAE
jgi:PPOX class probable F420-dependent enzyme